MKVLLWRCSIFILERIICIYSLHKHMMQICLETIGNLTHLHTFIFPSSDMSAHMGLCRGERMLSSSHDPIEPFQKSSPRTAPYTLITPLPLSSRDGIRGNITGARDALGSIKGPKSPQRHFRATPMCHHFTLCSTRRIHHRAKTDPRHYGGEMVGRWGNAWQKESSKPRRARLQ